jgi:hypothetical protein
MKARCLPSCLTTLPTASLFALPFPEFDPPEDLPGTSFRSPEPLPLFGVESVDPPPEEGSGAPPLACRALSRLSPG